METTIYHNEKCGTSRNTLGLIRNTGVEPKVVNYLVDTPSKAELASLIAAAGISVREAVRAKEAPYAALGLETADDDALLDAMVANPVLINRPFVATPLGVRLCRPSELVLDILPQPHRGAFVKEDGEAVIDASGKRVK